MDGYTVQSDVVNVVTFNSLHHQQQQQQQSWQ